MKDYPMTLAVLGIAAITATAVSIWQNRRLDHAQHEIQQLRSEAAQLPELRHELAKVRQAEVDQAELKRLREREQAVARELPKLRGDAAQTRQLAAETTRLQGALKQAGSEAADRFAAPMADVMHGALAQSGEQRLKRMQERLNLSQDQAQAIQEILSRRARGVSEAVRGVLSGNIDREKLSEIRGGHGDPEAEIRGLLTPEQQAGYGAFVEEEKAAQAQLSANTELLQMQHSLGLTEEQVEPVFKVLYQQSLHQEQGAVEGAVPPNPAEMLRKMNERKLQALENVLTPEQIASLRQQQDLQLGFVEQMLKNRDQAAARP